MSRPLWFVELIKRAFPAAVPIAKATKNRAVGAVAEKMLFDGDDLMLRSPGKDPAVLIPLASDEFNGAGLGIKFVRERGRVTGLRVDAGRVTGIVFEREGS